MGWWQFPAARRAAARQRLRAATGPALLAAPDAAAVRRVEAEAPARLLGLGPAAEGAGELVPEEARDARNSLRAQVACPTARAATSPALSTSSPSRPSWWPSSTATAPDSPRNRRWTGT